jgi:hypothetical protein
MNIYAVRVEFGEAKHYANALLCELIAEKGVVARERTGFEVNENAFLKVRSSQNIHY